MIFRSVKGDSASITGLDERAADLDNRIATNQADQAKVKKAMSDELGDHENRLQALEQGTPNRAFAQLKDQVEKSRKRSADGISGVAALTAVPQVQADQAVFVGAGVGGFDGSQTFAVGALSCSPENWR